VFPPAAKCRHYRQQSASRSISEYFRRGDMTPFFAGFARSYQRRSSHWTWSDPMKDTLPAGASSGNCSDCLRRSGRSMPYGVACAATLLAAVSWIFPHSILAGILFLVVAASSFGMAVQLTREKSARDRSDDSQKQVSKDAARVQAFVRNVRDGVHIIDTDGRVVDVSDSFCRMLGYSRDEMSAMDVMQWDVKRTPEELKTFLTELFANPETVTFETRHRRKDGSIFDVEICGCPIDINGQRVLFHSSRDITDRKILQERYRDIYANILSVKKDG
jgi:PAS domain S-box-containing protein